MGAMENAGAVTINEIYVFRSKVTEALVERRALTVLHELAHMWFGNLVTMRWWNDLWLNESFAEWASTTCQAEATQLDRRLDDLRHRTRRTGPTARTSSPRPTRSSPRSTTCEDVEVNFDGITYAKGASVLKQLVAYVGREPFRRRPARLLRASTPGATRPSTTSSSSSRRPPAATCAPGRKLWLETAGVSTLRPARRGRRPRAASPRRPSSRPAPRASRRCARTAWPSALYAVRDGRAATAPTASSSTSTARAPTIPGLVGREQPDLLLVNDDDLAYAKIRLDERSLATALAHPRGFTTSLPRALVPRRSRGT